MAGIDVTSGDYWARSTRPDGVALAADVDRQLAVQVLRKSIAIRPSAEPEPAGTFVTGPSQLSPELAARLASVDQSSAHGV